jgi:hypothetical protein
VAVDTSPGIGPSAGASEQDDDACGVEAADESQGASAAEGSALVSAGAGLVEAGVVVAVGSGVDRIGCHRLLEVGLTNYAAHDGADLEGAVRTTA